MRAVPFCFPLSLQRNITEAAFLSKLRLGLVVLCPKPSPPCQDEERSHWWGWSQPVNQANSGNPFLTHPGRDQTPHAHSCFPNVPVRGQEKCVA